MLKMTAQRTTATNKLLKLTGKIRAVSGGTGASKTYSIVMVLISYAQKFPKNKIDIISESYPHLEAGVMQDFKEIMKDREYWDDTRWNGTAKVYTFESGSYIKFLSVDKIGKAHGPRRDVLFLNECNYMPFNVVDQLITRTRKIVWLDWNPSEDFWFYEEYLNKREGLNFMGEGGTHPPLTYLDNEGLSEPERDEILVHKQNHNWWRVYGQGLRGEIEGRIYTDWKFIEEIPHEARLERRWLDFGYSNDPSAIGEIYYYNNGWIFNETLYLKGLSNKQLADHFLALPKKETLIVADSAEPKSIDELRDYGLNIVPCEKGKDSVRNGIQMVQDQPVSVTKKSINIIKEYRNYLWMIDKNGKILNEPEAINNHHMDGIRYALSTLGRLEQAKSYWDRIYEVELHPELQRKPNPAI